MMTSTTTHMNTIHPTANTLPIITPNEVVDCVDTIVGIDIKEVDCVVCVEIGIVDSC